MKLTREDVKKYGTEEEVQLLKEGDDKRFLLKMLELDENDLRNEYGESIVKSIKKVGDNLILTLERDWYDDPDYYPKARYATNEEMLDQYLSDWNHINIRSMKNGKSKEEVVFTLALPADAIKFTKAKSQDINTEIKQLVSTQARLTKEINKLENEKRVASEKLSKLRAILRKRGAI